MNQNKKMPIFNFRNESIVVTGGSGILGQAIIKSLLAANARVAVLDLDFQKAESSLRQYEPEPEKLLILEANVLDKAALVSAARKIANHFGSIDHLINAAGGNHPGATTSEKHSFFEILPESFQSVINLNLTGTVLPAQVFGEYMARQKHGNILNISSMNAFRPLTKIPAYSAAKSAVSNFTQWLAVHMAQEYSANIRVNALAPGFFSTAQNHYLLYENDEGKLSARGQQILAHTPMGRFGHPDDLCGTVNWLLSPAAEFITGIVVPVDGGFSAFSGI